ncbi:hypothetical protein ATO6_09400 [Oceanicola sp. 22II-s10i]|uniref:hypothetical protein n=1 Tax=Oceanicola sp. 22II-s10i TaxID=1317116 RepID=UPI000B525F85|nr:hypothetical protein [Oceanicola sp. 22II-s10i]OWU85232.1 hypothetical protein ATO6_09400 [Oceanicola sp. 22II-s10i]
MTDFVRLTPLYNGSWFARARDTHSIALIGPRSIPILQDWEDGALDWQAEPEPRFEQIADPAAGTPWWMEPKHEDWRAQLEPETVVWVRLMFRLKDKDGTPVPGRSKGIWRIGTSEIDAHRILLTFSERLGDVH